MTPLTVQGMVDDYQICFPKAYVTEYRGATKDMFETDPQSSCRTQMLTEGLEVYEESSGLWNINLTSVEDVVGLIEGYTRGRESVYAEGTITLQVKGQAILRVLLNEFREGINIEVWLVMESGRNVKSRYEPSGFSRNSLDPVAGRRRFWQIHR